MIQTLLVFLQGFALIVADQWWGFHLILFNAVYIMLSWWYYKWFRYGDSFEARRDIYRGYKYILIQGIILYSLIIIVLWYLPAKYFPDSYEDNYGNKFEFPPDKKEDMKSFALYFFAVFGIFNVAMQYYFFKVVRLWASKETLIKDARTKRTS